MSGKGKRLNPFQIALKRPDTFIGSAKTIRNVSVWLYDGNQAVQKTIVYNPGLMQIIREIGSNAIDNKWRSEKSSISPPLKKIEIVADKETGEISFWNDGYAIPVNKTEYEYTDHRTNKTTTEELYPAEVFFGDMFAGTNYDDTEERKTSGRNGMGAKAANVFSTRFEVDHVSPEDEKRFVQVYSANGTERDTPKITRSTRKVGYTKITFIPDYAYFKYPNATNPGMNDNLIAVIRMYAYEIAMITGVLVKFNGESVKIPTLEKYTRLFYPSVTDNKSISFRTKSGDECVLVETGVPEMDAEKDITHISFVNGIRTSGGGVHVEVWRNAIVSAVVRTFNAKKKTMKTSSKEVYPYLSLFIRCEVDKPSFDTQTKDCLNGPDYYLYDEKSKPQKDEWNRNLETAMKKIMKWNFVSLMAEKLLAKADRAISRKEGGTRLAFGNKADEANKAGGKEAHKCTLYITEGSSAKTFAVAGISALDKGRDYNGAFAIRGKFINAQNATAVAINENQEVQILKKILNLRKGVDYSKEVNFKTLRYGKVSILADADDDGIHIRGLLLNYFYSQFPGLIERGYIESFSTAVVKVVYKPNSSSRVEKELNFYSNPEYQKWYQENMDKVHIKDVNYYKGLGGLELADASEYFENPKVVDYVPDEKQDEAMKLAFNKNKNYRDQRKDVLLEERDVKDFVYEGQLTMRSFVHDQLVIFWLEDIRRSLPCIWDGFKESQRKIFYSIRAAKYKKEVKVSIVSGKIMETTAYHHGEASVQGTIVKMAQGYVGSNNIPLLVNKGNFGSRLEGGEDCAASRYIRTREEDITHAIFPSEDDALMTQLYDDDQPIEYAFYMPIIPMLLVNGSEGIATGFSTSIPCYNPLELVEWIEMWLHNDEDEEFPELKPWYRGFTGEIGLINLKGSEYPTGWTSKGSLNAIPARKGWYSVKELPIGLWTDNFKSHLEDLESGSGKGKKAKPKALKEFNNYSSPNSVHFEFRITKDFIPDMKVRGNFANLVSKKSLTNMVAIDENNRPRVYESVEEIMETFCLKRLEYYEKRKKWHLERLDDLIPRLEFKYKFVKMVVERKLDLYKDDDEIEAILEKHGFKKFAIKGKDVSYEYLFSMQMRSMTKKKMAEIKKEWDDTIAKRNALASTEPEDIWLKDLETFKTAYKKFLTTRNDDVKHKKKGKKK